MQPGMFRRIFIGLVAFCVLSSVFVLPKEVLAQEVTADTLTSADGSYSVSIGADEIEAYKEAVKTCENPSLECLVRNVTRFVAIEWIHEMRGSASDESATGSLPGERQYAGAIPSLFNGITSMYAYQPAKTSRYVADVLNSAQVAPAYAQGLGFAALDPILEIWKTFRNIAYLFFVVLFIVIGFMIMFRQKIGGNTAVTVQQAIPSIIISLIFVTFSYAIAGFLIDLMYLLMYLIASLFSSVARIDGASVIDYNIFNLGWLLMTKVGFNIGENIDIVGDTLASFSNSGFLNQVGAIGGGITVSLILVVAMLVGVIKLFFQLLKSYATIILTIVLAPLLLMFGAIPGNKAFGAWIKTLIGNLLPFPAVLLAVCLFMIFRNTSDSVGGFAPPFLLGYGSGTGNVLAHMMGLAIILALPELIGKLRDSIAPSSPWVTTILTGAKSQFGAGTPLGGRAASLGFATAANAGYFANEVRKARGGGLSQSLKIAKHRTFGGENGIRQDGSLAFSRRTPKPGIKLTDWISRSAGFNQPDYLNPATKAIDKRYSPETAKRAEDLQFFEDATQRAGLSAGGLNRKDK